MLCSGTKSINNGCVTLIFLDFEVMSLFDNSSSVRDDLVQNMSIPAEDVDVIFSSKVNISHVSILVLHGIV